MQSINILCNMHTVRCVYGVYMLRLKFSICQYWTGHLLGIGKYINKSSQIEDVISCACERTRVCVCVSRHSLNVDQNNSVLWHRVMTFWRFQHSTQHVEGLFIYFIHLWATSLYDRLRQIPQTKHSIPTHHVCTYVCGMCKLFFRSTHNKRKNERMNWARQKENFKCIPWCIQRRGVSIHNTVPPAKVSSYIYTHIYLNCQWIEIKW